MGAARTITKSDFENEILKSDLPAVVDFGATWCGPCQALAPQIDAMAAEYAGKAHIVKVDVDQESDLAVRFNVMSVPTILFFKGGQKVDQVSGNYPDQIRQKVESLLG